MEKRLKIVCDCDNVILFFSKTFSKWHNDVYNDYSVNPNPDTYDFGLPDSFLFPRIEEFWKTPEFESIEFVPGFSVDTFNKISEEHDIYIVSAVSPEYKEARYKNLQKLNLQEDKLILTENKIDLIINNIQPDICIEDCPSNIGRLSYSGIPTLFPNIFNYTKALYNTSHIHTIDYDDWDDLHETIKKLS